MIWQQEYHSSEVQKFHRSHSPGATLCYLEGPHSTIHWLLLVTYYTSYHPKQLKLISLKMNAQNGRNSDGAPGETRNAMA